MTDIENLNRLSQECDDGTFRQLAPAAVAAAKCRSNYGGIPIVSGEAIPNGSQEGQEGGEDQGEASIDFPSPWLWRGSG